MDPIRRALVVAALEAHEKGESRDLHIMVDVLIYVLGQHSTTVYERLKSRSKTPKALLTVFHHHISKNASNNKRGIPI